MFEKAKKSKVKLRLGICGPAGSGKTYSALTIAKGIGGKTALIDTERGSASLYADKFDFDVALIEPPYTVEKYLEGLSMAAKAGYDLIVIDSLSHAWAGEGGLLDQHDNATRATKNSYTAWREITPLHNRLVDAMLGWPGHVIVTMRSKTAYEIQQNSKGKMSPVKVGTAPIQREGMDYEFTVVFDLSVDGHIATASKDRTDLFSGKHFLPTPEVGEQLTAWMNGGEDGVKPAPVLQEPAKPAATIPDPTSPKQPEQPVTLDKLKINIEEMLDAMELDSVDRKTYLESITKGAYGFVSDIKTLAHAKRVATLVKADLGEEG